MDTVIYHEVTNGTKSLRYDYFASLRVLRGFVIAEKCLDSPKWEVISPGRNVPLE